MTCYCGYGMVLSKDKWGDYIWSCPTCKRQFIADEEGKIKDYK